ncbi:LysR family transcriptional regulator [Parvibacter caecicola]|uniref:LysR family transcriptional regulator n=1 Tax=Parvibacter caecicola TaxID=747645 RepID=UPI0023F49794|nr:LysR family transcriptional regulator [Parvibacter caecicola]
MELNYLREFRELAQTLNYAKAANHLYITQSTLSKHINALERELGCRLLDRDRRKVELTEAGRRFAAASMTIIDTFDRVQEELSELEQQEPLRVDGVLYDNTLASIFSVATMLLESAGLPPVDYSHKGEKDCLDLLMEDEIDIAFSSVSPEDCDASGLVTVPMSRSRFVGLMTKEHPLAKSGTLTIDMLRDSYLIKFADPYSINGWRVIERLCKERGFNPMSHTVLGRTQNNYVTTPVGNNEVAILSSNIPQMRFLSDMAPVVALPFTDDDAFFSLNAIYKKENEAKVRPVMDVYRQARDMVVHREG